MKYAIKKAAREGIDWVSINPYEVTHHRERKRLGNLEFYGNSKGTGQITVRKAGEVFEEELEEISVAGGPAPAVQCYSGVKPKKYTTEEKIDEVLNYLLKIAGDK